MAGKWAIKSRQAFPVVADSNRVAVRRLLHVLWHPVAETPRQRVQQRRIQLYIGGLAKIRSRDNCCEQRP
jgi:hypothetical protein